MATDNEASCDNDPNFAVICGFLEKFGVTCGLSDIDFLDLQDMLENTQEVSKYLVDMHVKLLRKIRKSVTPERWERSLVKLCHEFSSKDAWEIERFGYKKARLSSKLRVLKELLEMQFDYNTKFKNEINKLSAEELRCQPLGKDRNGCAYWFQTDENCQIRVYKEDIDEETWSLIAKDRNDLVQLINKLSDNKSSVAASASASASDAVTNEDSTSLESDKLGAEDINNINSIAKLSKPLEKNDNYEDDDVDQGVDWEHQKNDQSSVKMCSSMTLNRIDTKNSEQKNEPEKLTESDTVDKPILNENSNDSDEMSPENAKNKGTSDPMKPLTIEIEDSNSNKSTEEFSNSQNNSTNKELIDNIPSTEHHQENREDQPPLAIKPIINLRIKPITELLSPNHLEQITMRTVDSAANITEFGRGPSTYVAQHVLNYRKRSPADMEHPIAEDSIMIKRTRPTLLRPKKLSNNFVEVGEVVDEPVMYVMGEGSGNENEGIPWSEEQSPIVGEAVEEPVMYFRGEGNGAECATGNEKRDKDESQQKSTCDGNSVKEKLVEGSTSSETTNSLKQEFKLGTIFDTKTDKSVGVRIPLKNSRWDMGRPTEVGSTAVKQCNKSEEDPESQCESTLNLCGVSDMKTKPEEVTQSPPIKKPIFFFGPGSLNISPTISHIRSKLNCDKVSSSSEIQTDQKLFSTQETKEQKEISTDIGNIEGASLDMTDSTIAEPDIKQENNDILPVVSPTSLKNISKDMTDDDSKVNATESSRTKEVSNINEVQKLVNTEETNVTEIPQATDSVIRQRNAREVEMEIDSKIHIENEGKSMAAAGENVKVPISDKFEEYTDKDNVEKSEEVQQVTENNEYLDVTPLQVVKSSADEEEVEILKDGGKELHKKEKVFGDESKILQIEDKNLWDPTEKITSSGTESDVIKEEFKDNERFKKLENKVMADIKNIDDKLEKEEIKHMVNESDICLLKDVNKTDINNTKQPLENNEEDNDVIDEKLLKKDTIISGEIEKNSKMLQEQNAVSTTVQGNKEISKQREVEPVSEKETIENIQLNEEKAEKDQKLGKNDLQEDVIVDSESHNLVKEDGHQVIPVYSQRQKIDEEVQNIRDPDIFLVQKEKPKEDVIIEKGEPKKDKSIDNVSTETETKVLPLKMPERTEAGTVEPVDPIETMKAELLTKESKQEENLQQQETIALVKTDEPKLKEEITLNLEKPLVIQNTNIENEKISGLLVEETEKKKDLHSNKQKNVEKKENVILETIELTNKKTDETEQKQKEVYQKVGVHIKQIEEPSEKIKLEQLSQKEIQVIDNINRKSLDKNLDNVELIPTIHKEKLKYNTNVVNLDESHSDSKKDSLTVKPVIKDLITNENVGDMETLRQRSEITISKVQTSLVKTKHNSLRNIENNEIVTIAPSKKPKLSDSLELTENNKALEKTESICNFEANVKNKLKTNTDSKIISSEEIHKAKEEEKTELVEENVQVPSLKYLEKEIVSRDVVEEKPEEEPQAQPKKNVENTIVAEVTKNVNVTTDPDENQQSKQPVIEPPCVKKSVPLLTHVDVDELNEAAETVFKDPESLEDSDSDIFEVAEQDPLMVSDKEDEEEEDVGKEEEVPTSVPVSAPLTFNSFQLDFNDSPTPSPPPARILTRNRKRAAEQSIDSLKEIKKQDDAKRTKLKGKRAGNKDLRRIVEEQKMQPASSSEEGGNEGEEKKNEEKSGPKKKLGRPRKETILRGAKTESPAISSDVNSENSRTDACSTPPLNKKGRPRKKTLLGLEIPDNFTNSHEESTGSVRTSRRIAQIKIKEEAERRKLEEVALRDERGKGKKKGKKIEEDKDYKTHKKQQKKAIIPEEEATVMSVESESRKKKKKRKAGMVFSRKLYEQTNPWKYSSDDSTEEENEEEEEYEEMEPSDEEPLFKSDHEFSPESDLEGDGEVQPLKRARTVKKESDVDDEIDDTNCQKCGKSDHPEWILLCDKCDNGWHCSCLRPALLVIPEGDWFCPPCQHISLVESLENKLIEFDKRLSKREMEVRRKERLAYVGISLDNVLPAKEGSEEHYHHKKAKKEDQDSDEDEDEDGDRSAEGTSSESSSSSDDSDEPIYQLRQRRQAQTYRFNDYDDLINSAIGEEMESVKGAGNQGRGKDIATIVNANKEEAEKRKLEMQFNERPPVVPSETHSKNDDEEEDDEEVVRPKPKVFKGRKKSRKLNSLDVSSENSDSDEDFKGSSLEEEEEVDEDFDSDSSTSRRGRAALRRSTRARTARYDKDFINDESESDEDEEAPSRKKTRSIWDESESEDSDKSWGRRKKTKRSSFKFPSYKPKKSKKKKKKKSYYDDEDCYRKKPKIKYGSLEDDEDNLTKGRRTRGKKINFLEALGTDSEEENRNRKSTRKLEESEDEYVANEDEAAEDSELEKDEEIIEDDEVEDELASKLKKKRKNVIEDSEEESSEEEKKKVDVSKQEPTNSEVSKESTEISDTKQGEIFLRNTNERAPLADKTISGVIPPVTTPVSLNDFQTDLSTTIPTNQFPMDLKAPPSNLLDPKHARFDNASFMNRSNPIVAHQQQLPQDLSKESDMLSWGGGNQRRQFVPEDEQSSSIDEINRNFDDMNEEEMEKMMEEEEFANEQLKLVALQIEKEKQRKKREKSGGEEPKTPKKRGRKPKAALGASGGGIIEMGPSANPNILGGPSLHVSPSSGVLTGTTSSASLSSNIGLPSAPMATSTYPTVSSISPLIPQSIMRASISPSPSPYVTSEPKENEELSEPPGATIPLFSEISPMSVTPEGTPKKRRGRGKGKKTLAKEQAAAAAAAAAAAGASSSSVSSNDTNNSTPSTIAPGTPDQQQTNVGSYPITSNSSGSTNSPILSSKLTVATPPQPFAQSQPVPSVITRMLQQHNNNPNFSPTPGKIYGTLPTGEPPPISSGLNTSLPPNGIPVSTAPSTALQRPPPPQTSPYHYTNSGPRGGPYVQPPPPSSSPYPVPRVASLSSPHRLQQSQSLHPPMYHSHPMDPSPSGGGPINIPGPNQQERNSPSVLQPPVSGAPVLNKSDQQQQQPQATPTPPLSSQQPPLPSYSRPPVGHYSPGGPISTAPSMLSAPPRFVQQQHMAHRPPTTAPGMPPPPPFHPSNYPYGGPSYAPIPPPEEAQPPDGYQGSPYTEPFGGDNNAPLTTSDNSNSRPYDEEVGGEFGGLVSYFSSQREDDLET